MSFKNLSANNFRKDDVTSNILNLSTVNRTLVNKVITCEASNTDLSLPLHISLQLDLVLAPVEVTISLISSTTLGLWSGATPAQSGVPCTTE